MMEWIIGALFLVMLGISMVLILFTAIVFVAGIGEPSHKDIIDRKKRRPF
jgi:hypothetical protein